MIDDGAIARLRQAAMWPELPGDRYRDLRMLARGGMGTVYSARDTLLNRDVAIKVSNAAATDSVGVGILDARLADESRILARLEHPGIVPVHDAGTLADGRSFYVMKLVNGRTLEEGLSSLPEATARLAIFERIVETVAFAHTAGVVHRDLKPSNVMIGGFGEVLVLDWGVASVMQPEPAASAGVRVGTPGFMSPEQSRGEPAGPAADVYSLGVMLDRLLSGLAAAKRLRAIAAKCQREHAEARYADAAALAADLARFRAGRAVSAYRDTLWDHAVVWLSRYGVFVGLILAYLLMRVAFLIYQR